MPKHAEEALACLTYGIESRKGFVLLTGEVGTGKLLQVVLAGQPELEQKLKQPNLRQLRQRLTMRARTRALCPQETGAYVIERLPETVASDFDLEEGGVSQPANELLEDTQPLEKFDMVDALKTVRVWVTGYRGQSRTAARKENS